MKRLSKNAAFFLRSLLFLLIFVLLFAGVSQVLRNKANAELILPFYGQPEGSLDMVMIGSSRVMCAVYPLQLYNSYGIASHNCGGSGLMIAQSYFQLREVLTRQSPRLVMVDVSTSNYNKLTGDLAFAHIQLDNFRHLPTRLAAIQTLVPKEDRLEFYFPILKYHTRWKELTRQDFLPPSGYTRGARVYTGTGPEARLPEPEDASLSLEVPEIPREYFEKTVELCREEGAEVFFVCFPEGATAEYQATYRAVGRLAEELGVDYVNFFDLAEEIGFDFAADCYDASHCNLQGGQKVTDYLGKYIRDRYGLPDRRGEAAYEAFATDWKKWIAEYK